MRHMAKDGGKNCRLIVPRQKVPDLFCHVLSLLHAYQIRLEIVYCCHILAGAAQSSFPSIGKL